MPIQQVFAEHLEPNKELAVLQKQKIKTLHRKLVCILCKSELATSASNHECQSRQDGESVIVRSV
jgi:hypothetical protein